MPLRKRGGFRKRGGVRRRRMARPMVRRPLVLRKKYGGVKYFTETFNAGTISGGSGGGWFVCALSSMINAPQYFGLFDLGTILRYDVSLVPLNGDTVFGTSPSTGYLTTCNTQNVQGTTGFFPTPTSQLQLLQETGSRTIPLDGKRILRWKCYYPKCAVSETGVAATSADISGGLFDVSGNFVLNDGNDESGVGVASAQPITVEPRRKITWLNLNSKDAQNTIFGGIKYWIQSSQANYQVLIRIYAAFKEQN